MQENTTRKIKKLKLELNAVILAHSYQPPPIQDLADYVGDSLELSRKAASVDAQVVVFCGVRFMAETAHILAPEKIVLLPEPEAGCPLADCIDAEELKMFQSRYPSSLTVVYVNSSAEVKAESYACCTSANAVDVVKGVPSDEILFAPDFNLGTFIKSRVDKKMHIWRGACRTHAIADLANLKSTRKEWPDAETLVHPETSPEFWEIADFVLGTGGMIRRVKDSPVKRFIIGTEEGMVYKLQTLFPDREFRAAGKIYCPNMKKITPEKILDSLIEKKAEIMLPEELRKRAFLAVKRMTEFG